MDTPAAALKHDPVVSAFCDWSRALKWDELRAATHKAVKHELLDYLGCMIGGRALMGLPGWVAELTERGGRADAHIAGAAAVPAPVAALANGYYGHVLELDDTHDDAVLHAGAAAIPAALAAAQYRKLDDPKKLLEAVLLGIEVTCRCWATSAPPRRAHGCLRSMTTPFITPSVSPTALPAARINRAVRAFPPSMHSRALPRTMASTPR